MALDNLGYHRASRAVFQVLLTSLVKQKDLPAPDARHFFDFILEGGVFESCDLAAYVCKRLFECMDDRKSCGVVPRTGAQSGIETHSRMLLPVGEQFDIAAQPIRRHGAVRRRRSHFTGSFRWVGETGRGCRCSPVILW